MAWMIERMTYVAIEPKRVRFERAEEEPLDLERMMDLALLWSSAASLLYAPVASALRATPVWLAEHPRSLVEAGAPRLRVEASTSHIVSRPIALRHMWRTGGCQSGWNSPPKPCLAFIARSSATSLRGGDLWSICRSLSSKNSQLQLFSLVPQLPDLLQENSKLGSKSLAQTAVVPAVPNVSWL